PFVTWAIAFRAAGDMHAAWAAFAAWAVAQQGRSADQQRLQDVVRLFRQADPAFGEVVDVQPTFLARGSEVATVAQQRQRQSIHQRVLDGVERGGIGLERFGNVDPQADRVEQRREWLLELSGHRLAATGLSVATDR